MEVALRHPANGAIVDAILNLPTGARLVLFGPNGAGKSTMARMLAGTLPGGPTLDVTYLPQTPYLFRGSAGWNLGLGLDAESASRARQLADRLGVSNVLKQASATLSGGERQRLSLARTLARPARYVILDEPLAALDAKDRLGVAELIVEAIGDRTALIVTHHQQEAAVLGEMMAVVIGGRVVQSGTVGDVFSFPAGTAVAEVVGIANLFEGKVNLVDGALCSVDVGGVHIWGLGERVVGDTARVVFGAEAVTVFPGLDAPAGSARNRWLGTVSETRETGRLIEVVVEAGIQIVALLTPGAIDALRIGPGSQVTVTAKATAVGVIPT